MKTIILTLSPIRYQTLQTLATQTERSLEEIAKTVIKKAIETDQTIPTDWINQQLQTLNIHIQKLE